MKYQCIDSFAVDKYDDDGFYESGCKCIMAGTMWERDMSDSRIIGGDIRLDNTETMDWLEISFSTFIRCFRQVD